VNGCDGTPVEVIVSVTPPISASTLITDPIVCFNGTGTVQLTATGGTPPYTYNFEGKTANTSGIFSGITGTVGGTDYNWSVTDANGCAAFTGTISVTQPPQLIANASILSEIDCYAGTGSIRITASGGTNPLSYTLNGITKSDGDFTGITDGTWNWSVDDVNYCGPVSGSISIIEPTEISVTASVSSEISCYGGTGAVTLVGSGGTGPYEYTFNGQTNTSGIFTGIYAGTDYSYSVVDSRNCGPVFGSITITEPPEFTSSAVLSHIDCNGALTGSIDLTVVGGTSPFSFLWSNGSTDEDPVNLAAGSYTVTVTDDNGCTTTLTETITQPTKVLAAVSSTAILCPGGNSTVLVTASGGTPDYEYSIDGGANYQTSNSFSLPAGSYTVKVIDTKSCTSDNVPLTITEPTPVSISNISVVDNEVCEGESIQLNSSASGGTGTLTYSWEYPDATTHNGQNPLIPNPTTALGGTYALTVTDVHSCSASDSISVSVHPSPDVIASPASDEFCSGSGTNISLTSSVTGTTYSWTVVENGVSGASAGSGPTIAQTLTATGTVPGTATYTITPNANNCDGVPMEVIVTVNPMPVLTVDNQTPLLCDNLITGIVLTSNVANTNFSWTASSSTWRISGFSNSSDTETANEGVEITQQLDYQGGGGSGVVTYDISLDANGCIGTGTTAEVEVLSSDYDLEVILTSAAPPSEVCPGETVSLSYVGNSGNRWDTDFYWEVNTDQIGLTPISGGPQINNGSLSFTAQNNTTEPITGIISIVPWAFNTRWWYYVCSGEPYTFSVTVNPYHIICPTNTVEVADAGSCTANLSKPIENLYCYDISDLSYTVNGGGSSSGNITGYNFDVGTNTVVYTANDGGGNTSTCSFSVTVEDDQNPTINCPSDITVNNDGGACGADVSYTVTASDNCSGESLSLSSGIGSGNFFPVGTTTETWKVTDASGNIETCSFNVTVEDTQAPVLNCISADQTVCAPASGSYVHPDGSWDPAFSEYCSGNVTLQYELNAPSSQTGSSLSNVTFPVGTTSVKWKATDFDGNVDSCTFDVIVNEEPSVTINEIDPTVCLGGAITLTSTATGTPAPTYQWRRKNTSGVWEDVTDVVGFYSGAATSDLTISSAIVDDATEYAVEVSNSCTTVTSASVVLSVSTAPTITQQPASQSDCRGESVLFRTAATGGSGTYSYYWERKRPTDSDFNDASGDGRVSYPNPGEMLVDRVGRAASANGTEYRVTVTDDCGNSDTSLIATLTVNFVDSVAIVHELICQGEGTSFTMTTTGSTPIEYRWRKYDPINDNWPFISDGGAYSGARTATLTITNATPDESGQYSARATFNITVPNNNSATTCNENDLRVFAELTVDEGPDIVATPISQTICSGAAITQIDISNTNDPTNLNTTYTWTRDNTTALTGIAGSGSGSTISGTLSSLTPGTSVTTTFTITASNPNGCVSTSQVTVTVEDTEAPVALCQNLIVQLDATGNVTLTAADIDNGSTDNCAIDTITLSQTNFTCSDIGDNTVTLTVTDSAGNQSTCTSTVTVEDIEDPVAACKDTTIQLNALGVATIAVADIDNGSSDNCGIASMSLDITNFDCTDVGTHTVTLTVTDNNSKTATCTAIVTVEDTVPFTVNCQDITVELDATGNASITAAAIDNGSADNCGIASMSIDVTDFNCVDVGTNPVVLTVTNNNGATETCSATVTVEDTIAPIALCQDITVPLDAGGNVSIAASAIDNGSTDNCGIDTITLSQSDFTCSDVGANTVTLTVADVNGNVSTCSATVTVEDTEDPLANCQDITIQLDATGNATIVPADIDNGSSDNCGAPALSLDITSFDCTDLGSNPVVLTATDGIGNTATCSATVTVQEDPLYPVAISATVSQQDTLCLDDNTIVDISVTGGVGTLEYTFDGITNGTGQFTVPAGYDYNWSVSNSLGCGTTSGTFLVEIRPDPVLPVFTTPATSLCQDAANETYTATATNSTSISYSVSPASAGTINASTGEMDWDAAFSGQATITATASGFCSLASEDLIVDITPTVGTPTAITVSAGTEPTCQLTNGTTTTTYATTATDNTGFNWSISDAAAGSIDPTTGVMTWADGFAGTVDIEVTADGCNGPSAQVVRTVNIMPTVGTPSVPSPADSIICQGSSSSNFTTFASDATDYNWTITGAGNTISGTGTTGIVNWDSGFTGVATISVTANGCNGPSAGTSTTVTVLPTPFITISGDTSVCQNSSSDPEVVFTNPQALPVTLTYNINGGTSQTINIAANSSASVAQSVSAVDNFIYTLESVVYQSGPACANTLSGSATVTIRPEAPAAPGAITGNDYVLPVTSETYTISTVANATDYTWTVPAGWTIDSGQGTTSITVTTGIAGQVGDISVVASNDCGDSPETSLTVDINPNLAIIEQPVSQSDCYNNTVLFSVSISGGSPPIVYTWQRKLPAGAWTDIIADPDISGLGTSSILVSNIGSASNPNGTQYQVRITDNGGSDETSDPAALIVNEVLTMSPVDAITTICEGDSAGFSASTGGEIPLSMIWEKDGVPLVDDAVITGSVTDSITFINARPSDAGVYRLSVTFPMTQPNNDPGNPDSCVITSVVYRTLVVNPLPVLAGPSEVCVGQAISWTPNSGGTWTSSDPAIATIANDGIITGNSEGTVSFTFTETATGCSSTSPDVTIYPLPTGEIAGNSDICIGDSSSFTVNLTGTAPWDITYTNGTTPVTITGIMNSPHTVDVSPAVNSIYTLTAVNDTFCDAILLLDSAVVTVHPLPTAVLSGNDTICIGSSADLLVELSGAQPWSIIYTDGVSSDTITGINSSPYQLAVSPDTTTTYSLSAVSDVHCSGTSLAGVVTVTVDQLPTANSNGSQTICVNSSATVSGASASNGTILWTSDGAGSLTDETTLTPTYIADMADAGDTVTLTMTVSSNNACTSATPATATYTVIVDPLPVASAGGSETICPTSSVTVSGASALNGSVLWTHDGSGTLTGDTTLTPLYTSGSMDSDTIITLTLTVTSDNACLPQTDTAIFTVNVLPEAQVNQPDSQQICNGTSTAMITFSTTNTIGTTTYSWTNTESSIGLATSGTGNIIAPFTGVNTGTEPVEAIIEVTPHLTNGGVTCDGPAKIFTITVNPQPVVVAPIGLTFCNGELSDTVHLNGTPTGVLYDISGGASIGLANVTGVPAIPPFVPMEGTATLTIVPKYGGCSGLPVSFNVSVRPTPYVIISGGDTICQNSAPPSISMTNPMNLTVVVTYNINATSTNTVNIPGRSNVSIAVPTNIAGTFEYNLESVQYLASDPPACANDTITGAATIEVVALPVPSITGPTNICADSTEYTYQTEGGMSNYTWGVSSAGSIIAGGTPSDSSVTVIWNDGGSYNVSVRYNNTYGCAASTSTVFPVNVFALPTPTITGSTSACVNASKVYSTQPGMTDYQWTVSAGASITAGGGLNDNSVTVTWDSVGVETLTVNYISPEGCEAFSSSVKNITINPLPEPTLIGPDTVCAGTSGNVYTTESGMSTYVWTVSSGGTITSGGTSNSSTATIRWNTDGPQTISVSYINPVTGCSPENPDILDVWVDVEPVPAILGSASVCVGSSDNTYKTDAGMTAYDWTISAGGTITAGGDGMDSVVVTWNTAGANTVQVNYENASGCVATTPTTQNITVHTLPTPIIVGSSETCLGTSVTYSTVSGMTDYAWTVSAGGTIISGGTNNDNQVVVTWSNIGTDTIALNYTNSGGCEATNPTELLITVNDLPSPSITGPAEACRGGASTTYYTESGMAAYTWSVIGGNVIGGGNGTDSLVVTWNTAGTQTVSVNYYNANNCAAATPTDSLVNVIDPNPPTCPADMAVCDGDAAFILPAASLAGGVYSGTGVTLIGTDYWFDPAVAGPGTYSIDYTMPTICAENCTFEITVTETPVGSASNTTICSDYAADITLNSTVSGTSYSWTSTVISGSVSGNTNCSGSCDTMITDTLTNNQVVAPGSSGTNAVVRYDVIATKDGCSSTFSVQVQVRPQVYTFNLTWNSNFVEDFIEVCAGAEALSDNDIEILHPVTGNLVGTSSIPSSWNPTFLYGPSPVGPWTNAPGHNNYTSYYQWVVDFSVNNRLGYHYFILRITDPNTGCIKYSNPAILNVVSALTVEAGDPEYLCGGSTVTLSGAYVSGITGSTPTAQWSVSSMDPTNGSSGSFSSTNYTSTPASITYTPPSGYEGEITLRLLTNDPDGSGTCVAIEDYRTITVVPPSSFNGCLQLADWTLDGSNSNGTLDDSEEPCLLTLVGSDNLSGSAGTTDVTHCTGAGAVSFDWTFLAPPNKIVWHQEDQIEGAYTSSSNMRVNRPTNISAGDLIIVTIHIGDNNLSFSRPSGFVQIENTTHSSYRATVASFYKIATASEPTSYNFGVNGGSVDQYDKIYASRITGHNASNPIGGTSERTQEFPAGGAQGYRSIDLTGFATSANSMLVAALAVDINGDNELEFSNAPVGMTTVYYDDMETTSKVATEIVSGSTGNRSFQWPSYNTRNRDEIFAAAQMFTINPATNEEDAGYFLVNGTQTLLSNTNGASGSRTVSVNSSDEFGFRVGTSTNTGGPGRLIIYNLTMPNDVPVLSGSDTVYIADCQGDDYIPIFVEPTITDDCGTPVVASGYPDTTAVVANGCGRMQTITWVYVDDCGAESLPFEQTAKWSVLEPITITCPTDPNLEACTDEDTVIARYNEWVAGFGATGGCDLSTNIFAVPPLIPNNIACGDTLRFTFTATDGCGQDTSCTSTFTVQPVDTLLVYCPGDTVLANCSDPDSIAAAYLAWQSGFSYDGGCAAVTDNMDAFPVLTDLSCGGEIEFIYIVSNSCGQFGSCISTFKVETPEAISINVPAGVSLPLCSNISDIEAEYSAWRDSFYYDGGCNLITNIDSFPELGDLSCGGILEFTYRVRNENSTCEDLQEATSTFTVAEAPNLIVSCSPDTTIEGCLGIQAITDAYDTWVDGFRASGGCSITTNIDSIPELGGLICNGSITFTFIVGNDSTLCSAKDSCTSTFTIGAPPTINIITPPDTVVTGCNTDSVVIATFNSWKAQFDYTGGCAGYVSESDISVYDLPSSCGGTVTVKYSVWDDCSQLVTDSAKFTLNPELISVNAPLDDVQDACQTQVEIDTAFAEWKSRFGYTGGCGTVGTDLSTITAPNACGGTIIVNYSAQDICGQVVNTSAIFTINLPSSVLQEPTFNVPDSITIYKDDFCSYDADTIITGVPTDITDNCTAAGNLTMGFSDSITAGSCLSENIIYRKWTVIDNCLNETSQVQVITVADTTPPVVVCAADVNAVADLDECEATGVDLGNTTASDNCLLALFEGVRDDGLLITDPFPLGTTAITWTATDACGNTSNCVQLVTVIEDQPPTIVCPDDVDHDADPTLCYRTNVVIADPTADDNCALASVTWELSGATTGTSPATGYNYVGGETFNVGVTTVTYTVADSAGLTASCSFTVTIHDITPPSITANCVDASDNADPDMCSKVPATLFDPVYNDDCWDHDSLIVRWEMTGATTGTGFGFVTDSSFNVGVTNVTYYVSDPDGNEANCDFDVTILDVTPPVITAGCTDISETALPDECSKIPTFPVDPDYSDTCWPKDSLTLTYSISGATSGSGTGIVSGVSFNVGISTVTYTVTDPDNNSAQCSFTVTIVDVTPPVIDLTDCVNASDVADADSCSKIPAALTDPDYSDTCWPKDSLVLSYTITGASTGSGLGSVIGLSFNVGVSTVTYTVADPDGNTDDCSFTVTILDVTPPDITIAGCQDVTDTTDAANCAVIPANIQDPVYDDDCWPVDSLTIVWEMTGATTGAGTGSVKGESFNTGITTVTYTVSDPDGNEDDCSFTVTILPFDMPAFTAGCPPDVSSINDPGLCGADLTIPVPTVDDPCSLGYVITNDRTGTNNASDFYPVDTTYVVWTITPTIGDSTTCTQMVIVTDVEDPVIVTCPLDQTIEGCDSTAATLSPAFSSTLAETDYATFSDATNQGVGTDNCDIVRVTYIDVSAGTCPLVITRTWTVYDAAGNSASCDQTITVGETIPPLVDCPPNYETPSDFDSTFASYTIPDFDFSDNCTDSADIDITWTISGTTNDAGTGLIPSPYHFNQGLSTVTYTFTDACGNQTICTFTINVLYPPDITCLPPDTTCADPDFCYKHIESGDIDNPGVPYDTTGAVLDWTWTVYNPDGDSIASGTSTGISPTPVGPVDFPIGTSTIYWYAENPSGHDDCEQTFTVEDCEPPTFVSAPITNCVDMLYSATYTTGTPNPNIYTDDNLILNPSPDVYTFEVGDTTLNITNLDDNCCDLDSLTIHWRIDFTDTYDPMNFISSPTLVHRDSIVGTGQPSEYGVDILFPGDGVEFKSVTHFISYWVEDCNGNVSPEQTEEIIVTPRPELIKNTN